MLITQAMAEHHEMDGSTFTSYARPGTGSSQLCVWKLEMRAGVSGAHHQISHDEVLSLVSGNLRISIDGDSEVASAGDAVILPAGSTVGVANHGAETAVAWVSTSSGFSATLPGGNTIKPPWTIKSGGRGQVTGG